MVKPLVIDNTIVRLSKENNIIDTPRNVQTYNNNKYNIDQQ